MKNINKELKMKQNKNLLMEMLLKKNIITKQLWL